MKQYSILTVVGLAIAMPAWASCPKLAGTWNCTSEKGEKQLLRIAQTADESFVINGEKVRADGEERRISDDESPLRVFTSAECADRALKQTLTGDSGFAGVYLAQEVSYELRSDDSLGVRRYATGGPNDSSADITDPLSADATSRSSSSALSCVAAK